MIKISRAIHYPLPRSQLKPGEIRMEPTIALRVHHNRPLSPWRRSSEKGSCRQCAGQARGTLRLHVDERGDRPEISR